MAFSDIRLQSFRSYTDTRFQFGPQVNIIIGPNASGKTNLLEAILLAARGNSYRAKDAELIRHGDSWARVDVHSDDEERAVLIERQEERAKKRFKINDQSLQRLLLPRTVPVVLFEPNHLQLLTGSPELRRLFLDDILEQTTPGFSSWRRQYKRILAQRNAILKKEELVVSQDQLFVWDVRLAEFGERIASARHQLTEVINTHITTLYDAISQSTSTVRIAYNTVVPYENYASALLHKLQAHRELDFLRGFTAYGPHREDITFFLNEHPAQETASRGETRTLLLVCKIVEAILLQEARFTRPLLLLDDVFSELDTSRRKALRDFLRDYQAFITTTDADITAKQFKESAHIISL